MDVYVAIAEPTRRAILDLLVTRERPAGELVAAFPTLTQPAISRHLRILLNVGLVTVRPESQRRIYSLHAERMQEVDLWLERYRGFWNNRLDALERHLESRAKINSTKEKINHAK